MEMWMFTMWCYERGLAGSPRVPLRFQLALRAPVGRCSDLTRPFFADSHWEAEPYQRLFLQQICDRVYPGLWRFEATSQDDSLFPISQVSESSVWARHSETLQTPDCAAAARAEAAYNFKSTKSLLQSTTIYRTGQFRRSVTVVLFHPTHHSWEKDGYPTHLDRLTYFQTHGELHKGPCTFSLPVRELGLPVISLGSSALLLQLHI